MQIDNELRKKCMCFVLLCGGRGQMLCSLEEIGSARVAVAMLLLSVQSRTMNKFTKKQP